MAKLMLRRTIKQTQFDLEIDIPVDINENEDCTITGNMTFIPKKTRADGSFSIKITSSLLSRQKSERAAVIKAAKEAVEQAYDQLLTMKEDYEEDLLSANGQMHLQGEFDKAMQDSDDVGVSLEG